MLFDTLHSNGDFPSSATGFVGYVYDGYSTSRIRRDGPLPYRNTMLRYLARRTASVPRLG